MLVGFRTIAAQSGIHSHEQETNSEAKTNEETKPNAHLVQAGRVELLTTPRVIAGFVGNDVIQTVRVTNATLHAEVLLEASQVEPMCMLPCLPFVRDWDGV